MYFILSAALTTWNNKILSALLNPKSQHVEINNKSCKPFEINVPTLNFIIPNNAPLLDNYFCDYSFDIYSTKLIDILNEYQVKSEIFPVKLSYSQHKKLIEKKYNLFHLLEMYPAFDFERSDVGDAYLLRRNPNDLELEKRVHADLLETTKIRKLVLTKEITNNSIPFFRPLEYPQIILAHEKLKKAFAKEEITGCNFTPIEDYTI